MHRKFGYPGYLSYLHHVGAHKRQAKIEVMIKNFDSKVEEALKTNLITVAVAVALGISDEALQRIENDKVNRAAILAERFENEIGDINSL